MVAKLGSGGVFWIIQTEVMTIFEYDSIGCSYSIGVDGSWHFYIAYISLVTLRLEGPIHTYPTPSHVHDEDGTR